MPQKPLRPTEIKNRRIRKCFDYKNQKTIQEGHLKKLWIERTCIKCCEKKWIKVFWLRRAAKADRVSGYCIKCSGNRNKGILRRGKTWKGGRHQTSQGYVEIYKPGHPNGHGTLKRYVKEHRYVMEQYLGRLLRKDEYVHHKNGKRDDNRIENLELWTTIQPSGKRVEDLVKWAGEIISMYGDKF